MGVSLYPVLNKEVQGFDATAFSGKALAEAVFADGSAFAVLQRFSSQNAEWLADFVADQTGQEASAVEVPAEEWFTPEEGLQAVCSLMPLAKSASNGSSEYLADDLQNLEKVLLIAQKQDALSHLVLNF